MQHVWRLIYRSFWIWSSARSSRMAAAMTYFGMLSLAPLLVIAIAIAGSFFGDSLAQEEIIEQVKLFTTDDIANTVGGLIKNASSPRSGFLAGTISVCVLVFGASGVFSQLQETFNEIWGVPDEDRKGIWLTVQARLIGILMVIIAGCLLLTTLGLSATVTAISNLFENPSLRTWLELTDRGVSFLLMPLVLSLIFWLIPKAKIKWSDVWPAAMLTALLLSLSRYLVEFYLRFSTTSEVYGAAGSLVVLLIWIYTSGLVLFYGAAFSRAWAETLVHIFATSRNKTEPPIRRQYRFLLQSHFVNVYLIFFLSNSLSFIGRIHESERETVPHREWRVE